ncbi:hypothetical protein [Maricaulis parjimensis]|uniref:hypothetical protein n=1 Tax=Maricaulis parjimensis TaxID=144023 RepID=UPI001EEED022|nr:hypothetical protein [Maricaulis parjimensis]
MDMRDLRALSVVLLGTWLLAACSSPETEAATAEAEPPAEAVRSDDPPPRADAFEHVSNFLACSGNPYALCYYSGPPGAQPTLDGSTQILPCNPNSTETAADCTCFAVTNGVYVEDGEPLVYNFVEIGSILNPRVRAETIEVCHEDGSNCLNMASLATGLCDYSDNPIIAALEACQPAPVCSYLGDVVTGTPQTLYPDQPDVELISTFSMAYQDVMYFGSTDCSSEADPLYAGCMTAPCTGPDENGQTTCTCPTYDGPYQVGQEYPQSTPSDPNAPQVQCDISPNVWSAAYNNMDLPSLPRD